jgi:hypothetical protein
MDKVRVLVERNTTTKVPSEVFDYELPILQELHVGVTEVSRSQYKAPEDAPFDIGDAYRGLEVKYSQPDARKALETVYPNVSVFARAVGESPTKKRAA